MRIIIRVNRYVAFLDILGFSDLVNAEPLETVIQRVKTALDSVSVSQSAAPMVGINGVSVKPIHSFSFSDTFVLLSDDGSPASFLSFLIGVSLLTRNLFAQSLPVRGAITFGEADFIPTTHHAIGKAIVAAAILEKQQEWFGVVIDESVLPPTAREFIECKEFAPVLTRWNVPVKDDKFIAEALVINWRYHLQVERGTKSLFRASPDPRATRKIENTLEFARHVRKQNLHEGPTCAHNPAGGEIFAPWLIPITDMVKGSTVATHGDDC